MKLQDFDFRIWNGDKFVRLEKGFYFDGRVSLETQDFDKDAEIELYTGFKDKNDKKIYVGDICHYKSEVLLCINEGLYIVGYQMATWYLLPLEVEKEHRKACGVSMQRIKERIMYNENILDDITSLGCVEIVGNTHENKELLEEMKQ